MTAHRYTNDPVSRVEWVNRSLLNANDYNPNRVAPPELELLALSILEDGWTQPIVTLPDLTIVDGFHRYLISEDPRLVARYDGMVPVVRVVLDPVHSRMSTIRHNRARGTHAILPMAEIVTRMLADGVAAEDIATRLGMEDEELIRLSTSLGMPELAARAEFGPSWTPARKTS